MRIKKIPMQGIRQQASSIRGVREPGGPAHCGRMLGRSEEGRRVVVGREGFEPPKSEDNRFTVCPLWPLGYLPGVEGFIRKRGAMEAAVMGKVVFLAPVFVYSCDLVVANLAGLPRRSRTRVLHRKRKELCRRA
jgi:hypothetical protein